MQWILYPISWIFSAVVAIRRILYRDQILSGEQLLLPVIVIGNISVGGTGKTPLTLKITQQLIERGWKPLIVSRGYGGTSKKPRKVDESCTTTMVGDEPLMMARRDLCPVWIGKNRARTAQAALQANPECNVVLCDDGLQHYRLKRDVEIAVIDGELVFGNERMLPAGPLREPVTRLLKVDAIVVNGGDPVERTNAEGPRVYMMSLHGELFYNLLDPDKKATADDFKSSRNHAVAGIGNPQRFFNQLDSSGIKFTAHPFQDHHPYAAGELNFENCDAILMTEKDAVKCSSFADERYWVLRVDARFEDALLDQILRKINPNGSQTA